LYPFDPERPKGLAHCVSDVASGANLTLDTLGHQLFALKIGIPDGLLRMNLTTRRQVPVMFFDHTRVGMT